MLQDTDDKPTMFSDNPFPVVGVGASAGGLKAFKQLIKAIPKNNNAAYILVQHLDPFHESILSNILQRATPIPVHEITDNIAVLPGHIYIIPSNKILIAVDGTLKLAARPPKPEKNMPIDIFFRSLAQVYQRHAVGVVLSGTGTDGTIGLKDIKDNGGISFAQQPGSADYDAMPLSAIAAGVVDFVLNPGEVPTKLWGLCSNITSAINAEDAADNEKENIFKKILSLIKRRHSVDFSYYKQTAVRSRILRRMVINKIESLQIFFNTLEGDADELENLYQSLLVPATSFFSDKESFDDLCETILPALVKNKSLTDPVRIWIAGCSTGEEAYSMAICLSEYLGKDLKHVKIQLFATDVSEKAIVKARKGNYLIGELSNVSDTRLRVFFDKNPGNYQVKKQLRDMCVFAVHNFLTDPPFAHIDLISCRNVLMGMEPYLQKKALATFHYALNEQGFLLMGKSETAVNLNELFAIEKRAGNFYLRNKTPEKFKPSATGRMERALKQTTVELEKTTFKKEGFQKIADDLLLLHYTPVGVVVNELFDIVQFRGSTGKYLEQPSGKPSLNVIKMAREGLAFELRNLLHKARLTMEPVSKENILIENGERMVSVEVIPLLNTMDAHFLIVFKNTNEPVDILHPTPEAAGIAINKSHDNLRIQQLEKELAGLQDDIRLIAEYQETANEELQSANEELLSGSEELQSLNEELETSKEQLQNTVEELIITNRELYDRNDQYNNARQYSEAIIKTIRQPLLVLTKDLRVQRTNSAFCKTFQVRAAETESKFLFELGIRQWDIPALLSKLKNIFNDESFEGFEVTQTFAGIGEKTMLLNASQLFKENSSEQLILLAMEDITDKKALEKKEKEFAETSAERITVLEAIPQCGWTASIKGDFTYANKFFHDYTGIPESEILMHGWTKVIDKLQAEEIYTKYKQLIKTGKDFDLEFLMNRNIDDTYRWHLLRALAIRNKTGIILSWVGTITDIHDQTLFAEVLENQVAERTKSLKISNTELEHSNKNLEQFAYIASHDLQEPLRKIQVFSSMLADHYKDIPEMAIALVNKINASSERMTALIKDVLNFSKLTLTEFAFVKTDLNDALDSMLSEFDLMIEQKNAVVHKVTLPVIEAVPLQMKQLFYNLISNALKFSSSERQPVINISCKILGPADVKEHPKLVPGLSYCEIIFKDNGIGFDQQFARKIFLIFQRLNSPRLYAGTGIGLALCQNIAINHGGEIYAEAVENEGAEFHILLPMKQLPPSPKSI